MTTTPTGIAQVVAKAGPVSAMAKKVGVARQVADRWYRRGHVPTARAFELEIAYGVPARLLVKPSLLDVTALLHG